MPINRTGHSILKQEATGFSLIILLSWATEAFRIPHLLFGEPVEFNWQRALLRSLIVAIIWIWVHLTTKKILTRLHHLEEFLLVCSWCRKVGYEGKWLTMEEYFGSKFSTETSHGICPDCAQKNLGRLSAQIENATNPPNQPKK